MGNLIITIICTVLGFIIGYLFCIATMHIRVSNRRVHHRKPSLRIKRYWIGNQEFNVSLFQVKNFGEEMEATPNGHKAMGQVYHVRDLTNCIVGLIIGYDLKWFENDKLDIRMQAEIDQFVKNLEKFNRFLKQPPVVVQSGIDEAITELRNANQPILNRMGAIKNHVADYIETGGYNLIEFG